MVKRLAGQYAYNTEVEVTVKDLEMTKQMPNNGISGFMLCFRAKAAMITRPLERDQVRCMAKGVLAHIQEKLAPIPLRTFKDFRECASNLEKLEHKEGSFKRGSVELKDQKVLESVKSIRVGGEDIKANKTLLSINNEGKGGTRISTIKPYTILHTSIFQALVKAFVKAYDIKLIPPVVEPPFGACFPSFSEGSGPEVPLIDLVLEGQGSVYWRIWAANSLVKISSTLTCLGFVDGGADPFTSIVIGGHQIEDNLLQFDLDSSRLGFSSSLFRRNTTCSNFT
ncbi:probable aspartic proteinase GIP2 [Ricinus communis]|uniref:probable aspartic proteinase GIP2 n=1 Tax=Ricinus communis TaxID=3988 RepID=UPI00201A94F4|nr:probable aspartic proteinase GIP2 [Ricinus communis]